MKSTQTALKCKICSDYGYTHTLFSGNLVLEKKCNCKEKFLNKIEDNSIRNNLKKNFLGK